MWNDVVIGLAVLSLAMGRAARPARAVWLSWTNVILGGWLITAPFMLGYGGVAAAVWNDVVVTGGRRGRPDGGGGRAARPAAGVTPLPVHTTAVRPHQVAAVARRAQAYLAAPVRLSARGGNVSVEISPSELAPVLAVRPVRGHDGPGVRLGVDEKRLARLVASAADEVGRDAADARVSAPAHPVVVDEQGELTWKPRSSRLRLRPARSGRVLDKGEAAGVSPGSSAPGGVAARCRCVRRGLTSRRRRPAE